MKRSTAILFTVLSYVGLCLLGMSRHEYWQDEAHHLLLGRDSQGLAELIRNTGYEGHPLLWNLMVYLLVQLFHHFWVVQLVHVGIATACVVIILSRAPFAWHVRLWIVGSYFLIYEYSILTRHYSLALLLLLLILVHLSSPRKQLVYLAILLALMAQVHLFALFLSLGISVYLLRDWRLASTGIKAISLAIVSSSVLLALYHSLPPADHFLHTYNSESWFSLVRLSKLWQVPLKGLLPMPDFTQEHYWNTHALVLYAPWLGLVMSLLISITPAFLLHDSRLRWAFYLPLGCILLFFYLTPLMLTNRNCGYVSMCILAVFWLQNNALAHPYAASRAATATRNNLLVYAVLACQVYAGLFCYSADFLRPFSNGKYAADFLEQVAADKDTEVLLSNHGAGPAVAIYTSKRLYYLEPGKFGTFCVWNTRPFIQSDEVLLYKIRKRLELSDHVLLLLNEPSKIHALTHTNDSLNIIPSFAPALLKLFEGASVGSENYAVYRLK